MSTESAVNLSQHHLLLLDAQSGFSDMLALLGNLDPRLARSGANSEPSRVSWTQIEVAGRPDSPLRVERAKLSRHSALAGPIPVDAQLASALGLPDWADKVVVLFSPRDREGAPPPDWFKDADGRWTLFPKGLPERQEGRNLDMAIAIARRLQTGLRLADEPGLDSPRILLPDYGLAHDLTVYASYWLGPEVLLERIRAVEPGAQYPEAVTAGTTGSDGVNVLEQADPPVLDGYAIEIPLRLDGQDAGEIELGVYVEEYPPPLLVDLTEQARADAARASGGAAGAHRGAENGEDPTSEDSGSAADEDRSPAFVGYQLRWIDPDFGAVGDRADPAFQQQRSFASQRIDAVAAAVLRATDGVVFDSDGFLVAEHQLG